tara:strand:- start:39 stop:245 length:207 start_codon:yes stop_codon:yes gene_type:complete
MLPTTGGGDGLELALLILSVDEDDTEPLLGCSARVVDRGRQVVIGSEVGREEEVEEERGEEDFEWPEE